MDERTVEKAQRDLAAENAAQHNDGCQEWCSHCVICGVGILYGERCHQHLIPSDEGSRRG